MKRLILSVSIFFIFATCLTAEQVQLKPAEKDISFQFPFTGKWLPDVHPMHVGAANYTTLKNLRYTATGLETIEGYSRITTNALSGTMQNGFHFKRDDESHFLTKIVYGGIGYLRDNQAAIPAQGNYESTAVNNGTSQGLIYLSTTDPGSFSSGPQGSMLYADTTNTLIWGGDEVYAESVLVSDDSDADDGIDGTELVNNDITDDNISVDTTDDYIFIGSPWKIDQFNAWIETANTTASTLSGHYWTSSGWTSLSLSDGTSDGGVTLAVNGTVSFTHSFANDRLSYRMGQVLYWYRFTLSAGSAEIYKITVRAPLQEVQDIWNGAGRTCTSFQVSRSGAYEDYTYHVAQQSTEDAPFAAKIGGIGVGDSVELMFDDRLSGLNFVMLGDLVNAASVTISGIDYWDGTQWISAGTLQDGTQTGSATLSKSGSVYWTTISTKTEQPRSIYGKYGWVYRLSFSGTLTDGTGHDGTSIDFLTGIAAPVKTSGYKKVGFYSGRVMLIKDNIVDYSLPGVPWIFNGTNTSNIGSPASAELSFGDSTPITATTSLFNRYGSNIIESWFVAKEDSVYLLTGSQPFSDYGEPFIVRTISKNIGCPAPLTMRNVEIGDGDGRRNAIIWLDATGPIIFDGTSLARLPGIENYFDPQNSECVRFAYIDKATAYFDTVSREYNLIFPSGAAATTNNTWLVFSLDNNKWYQKVPYSYYPIYTVPVNDEYGGQYNYMSTSEGFLYRLDNTQTWNGFAIAQQITTGEFSPPVSDELGFWTYSKLTGVRLISDSITEDRDVTITPYADGSASAQTVTVGLDASDTVSRNTFYDKHLSIDGYLYKMDFSASSSSDKWTPLAWGYKTQYVRED